MAFSQNSKKAPFSRSLDGAIIGYVNMRMSLKEKIPDAQNKAWHFVGVARRNMFTIAIDALRL
jgi:hypothetical protein